MSAVPTLKFKLLVNGNNGFSCPVCHVRDSSAGLTQGGAERTGGLNEERAHRGAKRSGAPSHGGRPCTAAERAAEAPPLSAAAQTPQQPRRRSRGRRPFEPPLPHRPAPPRVFAGLCCQLPQRPAETWCMLNRCGPIRLLYVLGLKFPRLTRRLLFLCPHSLMKPLVVFVLGGPGAGKGTQCSRIVEVRPEQLAGSLDLTGLRAGLSRGVRPSAPPGAAYPRTTSPGDHRVACVAVGEGPPARGMSGRVVHDRPPPRAPGMEGHRLGSLCSCPPPFPLYLGTHVRLESGLGERSQEGQPPGVSSAQSVCRWVWSSEGSRSAGLCHRRCAPTAACRRGDGFFRSAPSRGLSSFLT